jgi:hypothetical protein
MARSELWGWNIGCEHWGFGDLGAWNKFQGGCGERDDLCELETLWDFCKRLMDERWWKCRGGWWWGWNLRTYLCFFLWYLTSNKLFILRAITLLICWLVPFCIWVVEAIATLSGLVLGMLSKIIASAVLIKSF